MCTAVSTDDRQHPAYRPVPAAKSLSHRLFSVQASALSMKASRCGQPAQPRRIARVGGVSRLAAPHPPWRAVKRAPLPAGVGFVKPGRRRAHEAWPSRIWGVGSTSAHTLIASPPTQDDSICHGNEYPCSAGDELGCRAIGAAPYALREKVTRGGVVMRSSRGARRWWGSAPTL
jgi:hypothetical protein